MTVFSHISTIWRARLAVAFTIALLAGFGCGGDDSTLLPGSDADENDPPAELTEYDLFIIDGKKELSEGRAQLALTNFVKARTLKSKSCDAHYGIMLADLLKIVDAITEIGEFISQFTDFWKQSGADFQSQQMEIDIDSFYDILIEPIEIPLIEIAREAGFLTENNCKFYLDQYPVNFSFGGLIPIDYQEPRPAVFGSEWDETDAHFIGAAAEAVEGALDLVLAHDISFQVSDFGAWSEAYDSRMGIIGMARAAAVFFYNRDLLDKNPREWDRFAEADNDFARALHHLQAGIDSLESEKDDQSDDIIGYKDLDDNGIDGGDFFNIGLVELFGRPIEDGLPVYLPLTVTRKAIDAGLNIAYIAEAQFDAVESGEEHERLTFGHVQEVFDGITLLDWEMPQTIEIDLTPFFVAELPIADYIPYIYNGSDFPLDKNNAPYFVVELEAPIKNAVYWIENLDADHFESAYQLNGVAHQIETTAPDCIGPNPSVNRVLPYIPLPDPSIGGMLWVDTAWMNKENPDGCPNDPAEVLPADNYTFNKLLNYHVHFYYRGSFLGALEK